VQRGAGALVGIGEMSGKEHFPLKIDNQAQTLKPSKYGITEALSNSA
jgi:hypothetical protein